MAAKRWNTIEQPNGAEALHTSEAKAYALVNAKRAAYAAGDHVVTAVTVYEYETDRGMWVLFDRHDFAAGT